MSDDEMLENRAEATLAKAKLDRAAADLDDFTVARLRVTRRRALAAAQAQRPTRPTWWIPLSAAAAIAAIAFSVTFHSGSPNVPTLSASTDDVEWLLVKDNPDFFNELDFYRWLEDEEGAG